LAEGGVPVITRSLAGFGDSGLRRSSRRRVPVGRRCVHRVRPFEIVVDGVTPADDPVAASEIANAYADARATWWIEDDWSEPSAEALRARIAAGPPRGWGEGRSSARAPSAEPGGKPPLA
jgi:hypothetical protein